MNKKEIIKEVKKLMNKFDLLCIRVHDHVELMAQLVDGNSIFSKTILDIDCENVDRAWIINRDINEMIKK